MANGQIIGVAASLSHSGRFRKILLALLGAVIVLGLLMAPIEKGAVGARINNEGDGLWFAITTVTGVGYGDMVPVTTGGRMVAVLLEVFGVVLFGAVMAFVSVELLRYQEDFNMRRILERLDEQDKKMEEIKKEIGYLVKK
ncbi:MAG: ion transporter [Microgenomates group bacterium GW2011_GWC1_46_16]|uniref:Potassium channel domain-containing protein n=2 Tax=Candidatus Collieribacteriota TaxID=1752725 RepID=A0A1F5FYM7_9BACT|nr:MAG: ion transporter [Microgenomates group bacterium GW2011_GWF1_46_12]KKU26745.1 MAG: ion transporter [Microgenomates group bacterium GW2011_GWC1_46_16]KKU27980.1 MAG: ion transporter [Microgenomates group bacterium GW2011_GWF2_46_18]KKU43266.1 MAG: ion transporter [Microgenomates group bacterium GW2011_GWA1_46_7]KKU45654.1 MAG: ion transporter [Microgenomates group bacterium GW2011_GWB1_46_7]KKU61766.1 MAG: ion transporter [Microgenomates group bacterium GW2011_GWE1_47_12]KKU62227.1 MAG: